MGTRGQPSAGGWTTGGAPWRGRRARRGCTAHGVSGPQRNGQCSYQAARHQPAQGVLLQRRNQPTPLSTTQKPGPNIRKRTRSGTREAQHTAHTQRSHSTHTVHTQRTHGTHIHRTHTAHTRHTLYTHSTHTARTQRTYGTAHSAHTVHTQYTHNAHTAHTYSAHTAHTRTAHTTLLRPKRKGRTRSCTARG